MGWGDDPYLHLLAVRGLHPAVRDVAHSHLVVDVLVLEGDLRLLRLSLLFGGLDDVEVTGDGDALACAEELARVAQQLESHVVVVALGQLLHLTLEVGLVGVDCGVPAADEVEGLGIGVPAVVIDVGVEGLCDIRLLARGQLIDTQAVAVALVAIVLHAEPGHILAVWREARIDVVADVHVALLMVDLLVAERLGIVDLWSHIALGLAEVAVGLGLDVEEEDVGVGGDGVVHAHLLAAGVGDVLGVGAPVKLLDTTKGCQRALVGLSLEDIPSCVDALGGYLCDEGVSNALHIVVPVAVVHVRDETA